MSIKKPHNLDNLKSALILLPGLLLLFFWIAAFSDGNLFQLLGAAKTILFSALGAYGLSLSITIFIKSILETNEKK